MSLGGKGDKQEPYYGSRSNDERSKATWPNRSCAKDEDLEEKMPKRDAIGPEG